MTTYADSVVALLNADLELLTLLTGGVYEYSDSGRLGLNRIEVMQAFQKETGLLKPTCVIYEMTESADGGAMDSSTGYFTTVTPITGWIYDDGDAGYATIDAATRRMYTLIQGKQLPGAFLMLWGATVRNKREMLLQNACYYQFNFKVHGYMPR